MAGVFIVYITLTSSSRIVHYQITKHGGQKVSEVEYIVKVIPMLHYVM